MDVVVAGGHGKIARRLLGMLAKRGDRGRGLIRNPDHAGDLEAVGAEPVVCDMEMEVDLAPFVAGADALVFAAGAGPGSGAERKRTVDLGAALKLIEAAKARGVDRYLMISSMGAGNPERSSEQMRPYIEAKAEADRRSSEAASPTRSSAPDGSPTTAAAGTYAWAATLATATSRARTSPRRSRRRWTSSRPWARHSSC